MCDAFVSYSKYETFGVAISEVLSVGVPVLSTLSGGVSDMLNDKNSIVVPVGDIEAIYLAMKRMISRAKEFDSVQVISQSLEKRLLQRILESCILKY